MAKSVNFNNSFFKKKQQVFRAFYSFKEENAILCKTLRLHERSVPRRVRFTVGGDRFTACYTKSTLYFFFSKIHLHLTVACVLDPILIPSKLTLLNYYTFLGQEYIYLSSFLTFLLPSSLPLFFPSFLCGHSFA